MKDTRKIEILDAITDIIAYNEELTWYNNEFTQTACLQTRNGGLLGEKDVIAVEIPSTDLITDNGEKFACTQVSIDGEGFLFFSTKEMDCICFSDVADESLEKIRKFLSENEFSAQLLLA